MQNLIVNNAIKSLWSAIPGNIGKGFPTICQQRCIQTNLKGEPNAHSFSEGRAMPFLLPGGGLEKLQGGFKEEQYFNANDNRLLERMRKSGLSFKCENNVPNWREFERMATACSEFMAIRQSSMLNRNMNIAEESFFLQEQKSLLERILDVLRNLVSSRRGYPPPYSHGSPFGPYYQPYPMGQGGPRTGGEKNEATEETRDENTPIEQEGSTAANDRGRDHEDRDDHGGHDDHGGFGDQFSGNGEEK